MGSCEETCIDAGMIVGETDIGPCCAIRGGAVVVVVFGCGGGGVVAVDVVAVVSGDGLTTFGLGSVESTDMGTGTVADGTDEFAFTDAVLFDNDGVGDGVDADAGGETTVEKILGTEAAVAAVAVVALFVSAGVNGPFVCCAVMEDMNKKKKRNKNGTRVWNIQDD